MSNQFYFGHDNSSATSFDRDDDNSDLPFPKPLDRAAFLAPDFVPATFLSSLSNRFQTLDDLQSELRELSQQLSKELVDLVNDDYQDFLNLGTTLSGGEEKVEEVRLGLLGFQRDVGTVKHRVEERRVEVAKLVDEKRQLRKEIQRGRTLLEVAERLEELEEKLRLTTTTTNTNIAVHSKVAPKFEEGEEEREGDLIGDEDWSHEWDEQDAPEDDQEFDDDVSDGVSDRLRFVVERFRIVKLLMKNQGPDRPAFLVAQKERVSKLRSTILTDINLAIAQEESVVRKEELTKLKSHLDD